MRRPSAHEFLRHAGIAYVTNARDGKYTTPCPKCGGKNLAVEVEDNGADAYWHCSDCGFSRPRAQTDDGATIADATALRSALVAAGYCPIPLYGKVPPAYGKNNPHKGLAGWQNFTAITNEQIAMWERTWPDAINTGVLTRAMPTLDVDILNEEAARACEDLVRERHEEAGYVLVRIGLPPKRAIPFRTEEPFKKFVVNLIAPNATADAKPEKIEFLSDGEQVVVAGIHPDTGQPYRWHGGEPGKIAREELPYIREAEAQALVDAIIELLVRDFGYTRAPERPGKAAGNGGDRNGGADWQYLFDNIHAGRDLHDSLRDLAAKMIKAGTDAGAVVNQLRALMESSSAPRDARWQERYADIPRLVEGAEKLLGLDEPQPHPASTIEKTIETFDHWLILPSMTPVYAMLGAIAANYLPGVPVWLGLVAPPSSTKTELLNSASLLPHIEPAATFTVAALLSGTPNRDRNKAAKGGLLRKIGDFGILTLKDFGSVLSMHTETRAELLAALREIYDGEWTRHVGSDGGKTLHWKGKLGNIFGSTPIIDSYHAVIGQLGDRWLLSRMAPDDKQYRRALKHRGSALTQMRTELAEAVAQLFADRRAEPHPISDEETKEIENTIALVVRLRGSVQRDGRTRELEMVLGAEGTGRIGLCLTQLLDGLDVLNVPRKTAMDVVLSVAMDSVPPVRRRAYEAVCKYGDPQSPRIDGPPETKDIALELSLPTTTVRRALEDLAAYRLIKRQGGGSGKADLWVKSLREQEE